MDEKMSTLSSRFTDFEEGREKSEDNSELQRQQKGLKSNATWLPEAMTTYRNSR